MSNVRFCWHCSRLFWAGKFVTMVINGVERKLHKQCKEALKLSLDTEDFIYYEEEK